MEEIEKEWQVEINQWGGKRRYRMLGNIKEYEGTVTIDGVEVPESEVEAFNRRRAADMKKRIEAANAAVHTRQICPFKRARNIVDISCKTVCPFWDNGCLFGNSAKGQDTADFCLICSQCYRECALYNDGCTLVTTLKSMKRGEQK